jgi:hypothetical protein
MKTGWNISESSREGNATKKANNDDEQKCLDTYY